MVRTRTFGRNGHMWFDSLGVKGQRQCVNTDGVCIILYAIITTEG